MFICFYSFFSYFLTLQYCIGFAIYQHESATGIHVLYFCFIDYAKAFDCVDHNELWKILKEMGIPEHLICLLRQLYAGQDATVRMGHGTMDCFQIGKEYVKAVYCHPAYLTYMQSTS